jgi:hypothetical protein
MKLPKAQEVAKFLTALAGAGGIAIANGLAKGSVAAWLSVAIGILTAVAVYLVPNAPPAAATDPAEPPVVVQQPSEPVASPPDAQTPQPGLRRPHGGGEPG